MKCRLLLATLACVAADDSSSNNLTRQLRRERRRRVAAEEATERAEALLLQPRRSTWKPHRAPLPCNNTHHVERPLISVLIQTFGDGKNAQQLATRLHALPHLIEVIVNDDSGRDHAEWLRWLRGPNDIVLTLPNIHEIRAYNRMARLARGDYLMLLQGDHCLPPNAAWLDGALSLFARFPKLGLLGGQMGFDEVPLKKVAEKISWGVPPCKPIPSSVAVATGDRSSSSSSSSAGGAGAGGGSSSGSGSRSSSKVSLPFMFVAGVNIGPLVARRDAFLRVGSFDESFSCAGDPGIQLDTELSLQLWRHGYQVGLWYSAVSNGVGGRKTRKNRAQKRARNANDATNGQRCERLMRAHDAAAVAAANAGLVRLQQPMEERERTFAALRMVEPHKCAAAL